MTVKKCDRCGKYYNENSNGRSKSCSMYTWDITNHFSITGFAPIYMNDNEINFDTSYDLCDDCIKELYKFMNWEEDKYI